MQVFMPLLRVVGWPAGTSLALLLGGGIGLPVGANPAPPISHTARDLAPLELTATPTVASPEEGKPELEFGLSTEAAIAPLAQANPSPKAPAEAPTEAPKENPSDLDKSPVYQKWRQQVPNVLADIKNDPSFRTRVRLGLSYFPSTFDSLGWNAGVEDIFLGKTPLTLSGDYQATFTGDRKAGGAELRYYLLPLGSYFNITPVVGYRYLETPRYSTDGLNVGVKAQLVLSRTGGADIAFSQTWVAPRQSEEVGLTKLSFGYALTKSLRLSTDIEKQNSKYKKDTRFGLSLEWMF